MEANQKSIMVSKRWLAVVSLILLLAFIDTISIVVVRLVPNKYAVTQNTECVPDWAILKRIILELFSPDVKFLEYIGFFSLFVRQCK